MALPIGNCDHAMLRSAGPRPPLQRVSVTPPRHATRSPEKVYGIFGAPLPGGVGIFRPLGVINRRGSGV